MSLRTSLRLPLPAKLSLADVLSPCILHLMKVLRRGTRTATVAGNNTRVVLDLKICRGQTRNAIMQLLERCEMTKNRVGIVNSRPAKNEAKPLPNC